MLAGPDGPMTNQKCKVTLADGSQQNVTSDGDGLIRIENVVDGEIDIELVEEETANA